MTDTTSTHIRGVAEITRTHQARHGAAASDHTDELIASLNSAADAHRDQLQALHRDAGNRMLTASEQRAWDAHTRESDELEHEAARLFHERTAQRDAAVAARRARWGSVQVTPGRVSDWDPTDNPRRAAVDMLQRADRLDPAAVERLAALVEDERADVDATAAARILLTRSDPHYEAAFRRLITAPDPSRAFFAFTAAEHDAFARVESARASLSAATAGALLPLAYDPNLAALTSDGSANPMRQLATVRTAVTTPYRAVTSAGVTAAWVAENTAMSDGSPTLTGTDVPLHKLASYVSASYELFQDAGVELLNNLTTIFADARDQTENAAFISGSGSGAPTGIITAISGTAGATVTATTRGTFNSTSAVDTFALLNALPPRARQSKSRAAFANNTTISSVRQQISGTGGVAVVDVSGAVPSVAGIPWYEASTVTSSTTSGNILGVAGDFSRYIVVDHVAGPSLEYVANVVDGSGQPLGTRGWIYWARVGGDSLDDSRFRFLKA